MRIDNVCGLREDELEAVRASAAGVTTAGKLLEWSRREPDQFASPGILSNVVVQDEFTHDIVVRLRSGLVLVYDST